MLVRICLSVGGDLFEDECSGVSEKERQSIVCMLIYAQTVIESPTAGYGIAAAMRRMSLLCNGDPRYPH